MGHVALARLRWGDGWIEPGQEVPADEPGRNYALMAQCGQITPADPPPAPAGSAANPIAVAPVRRGARAPTRKRRSTGA